MKAKTIQRRLGRPAMRKDKNGRSVPVRADRDLPVKWFVEAIPPAGLDDAFQMSGDKRFSRLYAALHDDAYSRTSRGTLCRRFGSLCWRFRMNVETSCCPKCNGEMVQ